VLSLESSIGNRGVDLKRERFGDVLFILK